MKQTIVIAVSVIIAGALVAGAFIYTQGQKDEPTTTTEGSPEESPELPYTLKGALVLDGVTNGCGGEQILVSVREGGGNVVSEIVPSSFIGFDCAYEFELGVPKLDCYSLVLDDTTVGSYPFGLLEENGFNIGYIDSDSVYGDPTSSEPVQANLDWPYDCPG